MKLAPLAERLKSTGLFKQVAGVAALAEIDKHLGQLPAAFVAPESESAAPNRLSGVVDQKVEETFAVVIIFGAEARRQASVNDQLHELKSAVEKALTGWTHPDASGPTEYAGGRLLSATNGQIAWGARFKLSRHLRV